jgi:hypothetical protein
MKNLSIGAARFQRRLRASIQFGIVIASLVAGCGEETRDSSASGGSSNGGQAGGSWSAGAGGSAGLSGSAGMGAGAGSGGSAGSSCQEGEAVCTGFDRRRVCHASAGGWTDETCVAGSGCVQGECVAGQCSDECTLEASESGKTCATWDMQAGDWGSTSPSTSLHDRAREYTRWLQKGALAFGGVGDPRYSDPPTYSQRIALAGTGDSALWTGTYLAAEALRLMATGAPDARAHVRSLVETLHLWFNISPSPGVLARFVRPAGVDDPPGIIDCNKDTHHCGVAYEGKLYDYNGHVSRDQYQGVMLGYALAYEALGETDEAHRALIRDDVRQLVDELMKERQVSIKLSYDGSSLPKFTATTRFMVIVAEELDQGSIVIDYQPGSASQGTWRGFQEFTPDLAPVFKQAPIIGAIVPASIPRDSSAIMLASFFRVALKVMEGIPELAAKRSEIESFYLTQTGTGGNVHDWLPVAKLWTVGGLSCGNQYYANNISMQPLYNWARLETAPEIQAPVRDLVASKTWPGFLSHKNSFFTFLSAANMTSPDGNVLASARAQLAQFPVPPLVRHAVDLRNDPQYLPQEPGCTDHANHATAVEVGERVRDGFMWQRDPWALYDEGDVAQTFAGVDYLVAYWLGRRHAIIDEDAASRCLRWQ